MRQKSFRGGVHPFDGKSLSRDSAIVRLEAKGDLVFLMNQHIGAPATPIVSVGDYVKKGQIIAEATGYVSANIASSVSGTVKSIAPHLAQNGDSVLAITIENDYKYETVDIYAKERDSRNMTDSDILETIKNAGIVGMGGAGFPTHVKLAVKDGVKIDYVICNGAECEPYITCDYRLMIERGYSAFIGMKTLLRIFGDARGVFAIEANKKDGINAIRALVSRNERMSVVAMKPKYPQGGERVVINTVTGRRLKAGMLPADAGCIVVNFSTLIAIADAVCEGKALNRRVVTVTGDAIANPSNFDVPIGISLTELIEAAGGFVKEPEKIISGGPMMGAAICSLDVPVTKTTSCILCLAHDEVKQYSPLECIRCGKCLTVCPERLMPIKLKNAADVGDYDTFEKMHGLECIGCGSCTYICPSKRRLSPSITAAKQRIIAEKKRKAAMNK